MIVLKSVSPAEMDSRINVSVPYLEIYHTNDAKHTFGSWTTWQYTQVAIKSNPTIPPQMATLYFPRARNAFARNDRIAHSTDKAEWMKGTINRAAKLAGVLEIA